MLVKEIQKLIEEWAPKGIAWQKDNIGIQLGKADKPVQKILVALDATDEVVEESIKKNVDLIITHHPLIFEPLRKITTNESNGQLIYKLIESGISLISAHTNLDFTKYGVSFALAEKLELKNIKVFKKSTNTYKKIVVFVPSDYIEKVTDALVQAGGGKIGNYDYCSYRSSGVGTFRGGKESKPFIGTAGEFEKVDEIRLEMIIPAWKVTEVIEALRKTHPYEEPAFDIYPVENETSSYGAGAIGEFENSITPKKFLQHIKEKLNLEYLRYVEGDQEKIKTVAVCGGSGGSLLEDAFISKIDAYVTGDINYHLFQHAKGKLFLVDAGHFETELPVVDTIVDYLQNKLASLKENIQVITAAQIKNPIQYV